MAIVQEELYETLRDRICLRVYPPGTRLREADLAEEFGISRTPLRAILQRLSAAGLVESRNGVGTLVTDISREELIEIYELRLRIAAMIGELSPQEVAPGQLETMERLIGEAKALRRRFDIRAYWRINHEQHFVIGALIGNRALREIWDRSYFQAARFWFGLAARLPQEVTESLIRELEDVERAMRAGDVATVGYVQRNYIAFGLRHLMAETPA